MPGVVNMPYGWGHFMIRYLSFYLDNDTFMIRCSKCHNEKCLNIVAKDLNDQLTHLDRGGSLSAI